MAQKSPAEALFSAYHRRILALLLLRPEQSFYVREIARLADVPAGSLHRELKLLAESGLLLREPAGNQVRYRANRDCPVFMELAGFFRKTVGLADVLREALAPLSSEINLAFIFGSVAQGKERVTSDVDVFVVGSASFTDVVKAFTRTHERLGREINPVVMPGNDFLKKQAERERFVARIIKEPKIFLIGTANDLGKPVKDRTTKKSRH
jgi:predicted nucleotidyltransferase